MRRTCTARRIRIHAIALATAIIALLLGARDGQASVIVFANRSQGPITFTVEQAVQRRFTLQQGDLLPVAVRPLGAVRVAFESDGNPVNYGLHIDAAYTFDNTELGGINLQQVGVPELTTVDANDLTAATTASGGRRTLPGLIKIPVKVLVDDNERMTRQRWEERLRKRVAAASAIFEKTCRIGFEVVAADTWDSDEHTTDYLRSMAEFEHEVLPNPARLAIGFTSQYEDITGATKLGGTRAAFYPYILLREWSKYYAESERLEVLIHELGHYLGAIHSGEKNSVMRPLLGDRRSRKKDFQIAIDPLNSLALYLIGEEYRARGNIHRLMELTPATRRRLFNVYSEIGRAVPNDPAAQQYLGLLGDVGQVRMPAERKRAGKSTN